MPKKSKAKRDTEFYDANMKSDQPGYEVEKFFGFGATPNPKLKGNLGEALFAISESLGWPDCVDSVSEDQALMCWLIVEKLKTKEFPKELHP